MKQRCSNPKARNYKHYGGRGIRVCREWRAFDVFAAWALENGYDDMLTIDRRHNDRDYEPSNCRWIPRREQSIGRRSWGNTGYTGIHKDKSGKYQVQVWRDGRLRYVGVRDTLSDALKLRDNQ